MSLYKNISGIMASIFHVGGPTGPTIKNNAGAIEIKAANGTTYAQIRALQIQSSNDLNDIPILLDLKGSFPLIEFSFDGASAPSAGDNTTKFGFCHTTGGSYTVGDVIYDTGTALIKINVVRGVFTTTAITGTVSMNANGIYVGSGATWTLKGDGASTDTALEKVVAITFAYTDATKDSTTSIPDGATITRVSAKVTTPFNGTAPTLLVQVNGSSPVTVLATTESDLTSANQYDNETLTDIGATGTGMIRATITPDSSSAGAAKVFVFFTTPGA